MLRNFTHLVAFSFLLIFSAVAQIPAKVEQLTDDQIKDFLQKAQASGLNEAQIEQMALQRGYSQSDIAKMRDRIARVKSGQVKKESSLSEETETSRFQAEEVAKKAAVSLAVTRPATDKKTAKSVSDSVGTIGGKEVYGAAFFREAGVSFEPNLRIATPKNYILGPEDELNVDMFGSSVQAYKLKVSPEGTVRLENSGPILVSGLTVDEARSKIASRLKQLYSMPGVGIQVTLGNIRSIRVTITGEVIRPGSYSVSSLATVFNAIYQSGGPNTNGSFRTIKLRRNNKIIRSIDLYDFLLNGDEKDNVGLRDQDVIVFPDYAARVEMRGEVRRPLIFETKPGETLKDVMRFAGGFTDQAYSATLSIRRNTSKELKIINVSRESFDGFELQNGDKITVGTILNRYENRVEIAGAVFRPGEFALDESVGTVRQLIEKADGVRGDAFLGRGFIRREKDNLDTENISFDIGKLLKGEIADIPLKRQDFVMIKSINELREPYSVSIGGAINNEGVYDYVENMRIGDLIMLAGGFKEGAVSSRIEVARRIKTDTATTLDASNVQVFTINLDKTLKISTEDASFVLQPFDAVSVRSSPLYEVQKTVFIKGEINFPGAYSIRNKEERLSDLIERAGGLKPKAYLKAARFYRDGELVAVDLNKILDQTTSNDNLRLEDRDTLMIPQKDELVRIFGAVLNPATVNFETSRLSDYISQAGGFTADAIKRRVYVTYANGKIASTKKFLFFRSSPQIEPGSTITVPMTDESKRRKMEPAERIAVFSLLGSLLVATGSVLVAILRK